MRKYAIPKTFYAILIALILSLSIGYTYAYFSAYKTADGGASIHNVNVNWYNLYSLKDMDAEFGENTTIQVASKLKRGACSTIYLGTEGEDNYQPISLALSSESQIGVYCRVKLEAIYTSKTVTDQDCSEWIKLANNNDDGSYTLLENSGTWIYLNGYYYYGAEDTSTGDKDSNGIGVIPIPILNEDITPVASLLYLDDEQSSADIYGATVTITLTLESVQAANEAYKTWWKSAS